MGDVTSGSAGSAAGEARGVVFPAIASLDGRRSTSATGRAIVADALLPVDPIGSAAAARETSWRSGYLPHFRRLVEAGLGSGDDALAVARAGLASVHERMRYAAPAAGLRETDRETDLADAIGRPVGDPLDTEVLDLPGTAETELTVPYRGTRLGGDALRAQVAAWVAAGVAEPSLVEAVDDVLAHPHWLALPGWTLVSMGAAAEMGPLRSLLRWGATVAAVDLPRAPLWERLLADTADLAGRLLVPTRAGSRPLPERAGVDLLHDLPAAAQWVSALPGRLVLGNHVYADGATNVRVCVAVDALSEAVRAGRPSGDVALAMLATPTDVFAVPRDAVEASAAAYATSGLTRVLRVPLRTLTGGRLLRRNYLPGVDPGVNDSVVLQQGPNYLLAKRVQRWRAAVARAEGTPVSFRVAPPTRTRSVVKNRALAAAYAGAHRFGIEVFEPGTSNTLMAALLVRDLMAPRPSLGHPWRDEADAAVHGGLWRTAYEPRSALGLAALLGLGSAR